MRIAVIGSGISGLGAAYYLSRKHTVWLFEKDNRLGGHTHTVTVDTPKGPLAVDTGFIVHNDRTYPNLIRLFAELGVATQASDMSFAVNDLDTGFEYSSRGLRGFFAQPSSWVDPAQYRLLTEILRFNRQAPRLLDDPTLASITLGDVIDQGRYSDVFTERYLYPMASAVWSMSTDGIRHFPAFTLLRFFQNHGMLGINTHPKWKVVKGGSNEYLAPLSKPFAERIHKGCDIALVERAEDSVTIRFRDAAMPPMTFDQVVFACHGNQVLPLLADATYAERDVLQHFVTSRNDVVLHTDENLLAKRDNARASWNYNLCGKDLAAATVTYHMNRLQSLQTDQQYCVTLNGTERIREEKILRRFVYHHPVYDRAAVAAQQRWSEISGAGKRTHFCGAYWFYGFHEDGLNSALRVAKSLGVDV
ncbi:amine oxidase [Bryobacterales bacterium F-183]|nr:amine oxidase [Bryobacterales bacterium F-183]